MVYREYDNDTAVFFWIETLSSYFIVFTIGSPYINFDFGYDIVSLQTKTAVGVIR